MRLVFQSVSLYGMHLHVTGSSVRFLRRTGVYQPSGDCRASRFYFYVFIWGCTGSSLLCVGFLQLRQARASLQLQCSGFSLQWLLLLESTGLRASAQQLWHFVASKHVESSWTRDQTHVPHIGRQTLNHWTTREVQDLSLQTSPSPPKCLSTPTSALLCSWNTF